MTPVQSLKTFHKIRKLPYKPEFTYNSDIKQSTFCIENPDINIISYKNNDKKIKKKANKEKDIAIDAILAPMFRDYEEIKAESLQPYGLLVADRSGRNNLPQDDLMHGLLARAVYHMYNRRESNRKDIFQQMGLVREIKSLNLKPIVKETDEFGHPTHFSLAADGVTLNVYKKIFNDIEYYSMKIENNVVLLKSPREYSSDRYDAKKLFDYYSNPFSLNLLQKYDLIRQIKKSDAPIKISPEHGVKIHAISKTDFDTVGLSKELQSIKVIANKVTETQSNIGLRGEKSKKRYNIAIYDKSDQELYREYSVYAYFIRKIMHNELLNQK